MLTIVQTKSAFSRPKYMPRAVQKAWAVIDSAPGRKSRRVYGEASLSACQRFISREPYVPLPPAEENR